MKTKMQIFMWGMGVVGAAIFAPAVASADSGGGTAAGAAAMRHAGVGKATEMHVFAICMLRAGGADWGNIAARIQKEFGVSGAEAYQAGVAAVYKGCPRYM